MIMYNSFSHSLISRIIKKKQKYVKTKTTEQHKKTNREYKKN